MTKIELYANYKLEDFFYKHVKPDRTHNGFTFKQNEYYYLEEDEGGAWVKDDNGEWHDLYDIHYGDY